MRSREVPWKPASGAKRILPLYQVTQPLRTNTTPRDATSRPPSGRTLKSGRGSLPVSGAGAWVAVGAVASPSSGKAGSKPGFSFVVKAVGLVVLSDEESVGAVSERAAAR